MLQLSSFLFFLAIDFIMGKAVNGIPWKDGIQLTDLNFADDASLLAGISGSLQDMTSNLDTEAGKTGLSISADKTKALLISNWRRCQQKSQGEHRSSVCFTIVVSTEFWVSLIGCTITSPIGEFCSKADRESCWLTWTLPNVPGWTCD